MCSIREARGQDSWIFAKVLFFFLLFVGRAKVIAGGQDWKGLGVEVGDKPSFV